MLLYLVNTQTSGILPSEHPIFLLKCFRQFYSGCTEVTEVSSCTYRGDGVISIRSILTKPHLERNSIENQVGAIKIV